MTTVISERVAEIGGLAERHRLLVIFNPKAGWRRRRRLQAVLDRLRRQGCRITVRETTAPGDAESLARMADGAGGSYDVIVAAGGDGTINEVVNGLATAAGDVPPPPLAILPLGTANVLAAEIGLDPKPSAVADGIAAGPALPVAVGRANGRYFTMMAGVGFDAHVVAGVSLRLKRLIGKGAYLVETLRQLRRFPFHRYAVTIDDIHFDAASVIVAKCHFYGGRFICAPLARLDAPDFQVCLFLKSGRWNAIRYAVALALGRLHRLPDYRIIQGKRIIITGPEGDPVQGDGDIIARLPVAIELSPRHLTLVMPVDAER
ncbi:diacylglycerol/lipid kinase family protein [Rhodospirillaceae bacterium SYSU D60014]|uniref:diacylglycerol/lipid kinase family protein n=1 Tax=Virgifigura deserti TaxID=2268457 RepID=UPI000E6725FD